MTPFSRTLAALFCCLILFAGGPARSEGAGSAPAAEAAGSRRALTTWRVWNWLHGDGYELDSVERFFEKPNGRLSCETTHLVEYRGTTIRYYGPVRVDEAFRERLQRFEEVVAAVAVEVYGRAPRRVRHYGAYSCRASRNRKHRLSEHALGNAIDIVGFDFGAAAKTDTLPADLPKQLRWGFDVRVLRHWTATKGDAALVHRRFLRTLGERLTERRDVFRCMFGPGHRGHADHFHFDMAPWRYVDL